MAHQGLRAAETVGAVRVGITAFAFTLVRATRDDTEQKQRRTQRGESQTASSEKAHAGASYQGFCQLSRTRLNSGGGPWLRLRPRISAGRKARSKSKKPTKCRPTRARHRP